VSEDEHHDPSAKPKTAGGELALRAFGPFADAFGLEIAKLPPFVTSNLQRFAHAFQSKSTGEFVPPSPRLLRGVFEDAAWADDEILAEYFGGLCAASNSSVASDRAVSIAALLRRLSALQIRSHYVLYSELVRCSPLRGRHDLRWTSKRMQLHTEIDLDDFMEALDLGAAGKDQRRDALDHVVLGLARESLIDEDDWDYVVDSAADRPKLRRPHVAFHPSPLGAELYLWAGGSELVDQTYLLDAGIELVFSSDVVPAPRATTVVRSCRDSVDDMDDFWRDRDLPNLHRAARAFVANNPTRAPGYFYQAILAAVEHGAVDLELMRSASRYATDSERESGLTTLDRVIIRYPSRFAQLMELAVALEHSASDTQEPMLDTDEPE
jgi:hypothetical protein